MCNCPLVCWITSTAASIAAKPEAERKYKEGILFFFKIYAHFLDFFHFNEKSCLRGEFSYVGVVKEQKTRRFEAWLFPGVLKVELDFGIWTNFRILKAISFTRGNLLSVFSVSSLECW